MDREQGAMQDDHVVARSNLILKGGDKFGSHVFLLNGADQDARGMHWSAITHHVNRRGVRTPIGAVSA
jgi:hypothetical protein